MTNDKQMGAKKMVQEEETRRKNKYEENQTLMDLYMQLLESNKAVLLIAQSHYKHLMNPHRTNAFLQYLQYENASRRQIQRKTLLHIITVMRADPNTRSMMQLKILVFVALNQIT